jgi:pyruvyl transferase EpsO
MSEAQPTNAALIERLTATIRAALDPLIEGAPHLALLDFPNHWNVGDSAIWLGDLAYMQSARGRLPDYTCNVATYDPDALRKHAPDGPILLHGGGNFGDLYLLHQDFRERVCADFPDRPLIQLPQTIYFEDETRLDQARATIAAHPNFTLLARDSYSYEIARTFDCTAALVPDMAFCLDDLSALRHVPSRQLVALLREDRESNEGDVVRTALPPKTLATDWKREDLATLQMLAAYVTPRWGETRTSIDLAQHRLARGLEILSSGKYVVTDRLHGHILCLLLGVPHLVLDNSYRKNATFIETWTSGVPTARFAPSLKALEEWLVEHGLKERFDPLAANED